jgi:hypothetical protein
MHLVDGFSILLGFIFVGAVSRIPLSLEQIQTELLIGAACVSFDGIFQGLAIV